MNMEVTLVIQKQVGRLQKQRDIQWRYVTAAVPPHAPQRGTQRSKHAPFPRPGQSASVLTANVVISSFKSSRPENNKQAHVPFEVLIKCYLKQKAGERLAP